MRILLLFASCSINEEDYLLKHSKIGLQNSIINFQRNIEEGIDLLNLKYDLINFYPIGSYKKNNSKIYYKKNETIDNNRRKINLAIINLPIIKQIYLYYQAKFEIKKWIKSYESEQKIILMYDLLMPYLHIIGNLKKDNKLKTLTIIADLPNEYGYKKKINVIKNNILKLIGTYSLHLCKKINYFGLITPFIADVINIKSSQYAVIEGFSNHKRYYTQLLNNNKTIILYSGALLSIYGLDILIDAFKKIKSKKFELWFCGSGDYEKEILKFSIKDNRIKYFGYLNNNETAILQSKATILINPRQNTESYTKYSFPSKIIEYLSAARLVIGYKLDGIPSEYYNYIFTPTDNSSTSLSKLIITISKMPFEHKQNIANKGRDYVLKRTCPKTQIEKLIKLIK